MRLVKATKEHRSESSIPLIVKTGEILNGQERETEWDGWLWCRNKDDVHGWVPKTYLRPIEGKDGKFQLLQDYSSRELNVQIGDDLIVLAEESSWVWVRTILGEEGWVPLNILEEQEDKPSSIPDLNPM